MDQKDKVFRRVDRDDVERVGDAISVLTSLRTTVRDYPTREAEFIDAEGLLERVNGALEALMDVSDSLREIVEEY